MSQKEMKPTATPEKALFNARRLVVDSKKNGAKGKQTRAQPTTQNKVFDKAAKGSREILGRIVNVADDLTR